MKILFFKHFLNFSFLHGVCEVISIHLDLNRHIDTDTLNIFVFTLKFTYTV